MAKRDRIKNKKANRRKARIRSRISGTEQKPRLSVFRSSRYTYAQLIDDANGKTVLSASTFSLEGSKAKKGEAKKQDLSSKLGEFLAKKALEKGIKQAVFDRGAYKFHGRVKAVAEGAKKAGLNI